jgi:hypothetical protein
MSSYKSQLEKEKFAKKFERVRKISFTRNLLGILLSDFFVLSYVEYDLGKSISYLVK